MDWQQAIEKNRVALAAVVAGLIAMARQAKTLPRPVRCTICRILRPAESALRRLIVIVAAVIRQKARQQREEAAERPLPDFSSFARTETLPAFPLIDPRKVLGGFARPTGAATPRISVPGVCEAARPSGADDTQNAAALRRRIRRFQYALANLKRQARRLNRLMARRSKAPPGPGRIGPIRPGHPPGYRRRSPHEVHAILAECHFLAMEYRRKPP